MRLLFDSNRFATLDGALGELDLELPLLAAPEDAELRPVAGVQPLEDLEQRVDGARRLAVDGQDDIPGLHACLRGGRARDHLFDGRPFRLG